MHIVHLIRSAGIGGAERVLLNGVPAQRKIGLESTVAVLDPTPQADNPFLKRLAQEGIPHEHWPDPGSLNPQRMLRLLGHLRQRGVDLLHVHGYRAATYGLVAARMARCKIVLTRHGVLSRNLKERFVEELELLLANQMDAVIPVAEHLAHSVSAYCQVLTNGIPLPAQEHCAQLPDFPRRLLFVGRLSPEKNPRMALEVFFYLRRHFTDLELDVVGEGPLQRELMDLAHRECRGRGVRFHGFCDPQPFYRDAGILMLTSLREGLPLVALEAMASQLPVMATDVGGLPGLLEAPPACGFVAPVSSFREYAQQLARLLRQPGLARQMGLRGRARVLQDYSLKGWAQRHMELYHHIAYP